MLKGFLEEEEAGPFVFWGGKVFVVVWMGFERGFGSEKLLLWKERLSSWRSVWPRSPWFSGGGGVSYCWFARWCLSLGGMGRGRMGVCTGGRVDILPLRRRRPPRRSLDSTCLRWLEGWACRHLIDVACLLSLTPCASEHLKMICIP